jgi:chemotaxis methyl-accepting protein methylase
MRVQSHYTKFLRNLPQMEVLADLIDSKSDGSPVRITSIGCSTGAELYSTLYVLRSIHPKAKVLATGVDVSKGVIEVAQRAIYDVGRPNSDCVGTYAPGTNSSEVAELSSDVISSMFERNSAGSLRVRDWIRADTTWLQGDATDPTLADRLGPQDVVVANNILGPMNDVLAETCVRNLLKIVPRGGYLVVDGIDLDLRARLFPQIGLEPHLARLEEIHCADAAKQNWPWDRWAHEPIVRATPDWKFRYCSIFRKVA